MNEQQTYDNTKIPWHAHPVAWPIWLGPRGIASPAHTQKRNWYIRMYLHVCMCYLRCRVATLRRKFRNLRQRRLGICKQQSSDVCAYAHIIYVCSMQNLWFQSLRFEADVLFCALSRDMCVRSLVPPERNFPRRSSLPPVLVSSLSRLSHVQFFDFSATHRDDRDADKQQFRDQ